nr:hypothetical protein [Marinicella sp. W31]MDC2877096.1 hypothetical protein [Marinicella sp. W31]
MRDVARENISFLNSGVVAANLTVAGIVSLAHALIALLTAQGHRYKTRGNVNERRSTDRTPAERY